MILQNTSMSKIVRRRQRTLLLVNNLRYMEGDLLELPRLGNGHLQRWDLKQTSPLAARESGCLVR